MKEIDKVVVGEKYWLVSCDISAGGKKLRSGNLTTRGPKEVTIIDIFQRIGYYSTPVAYIRCQETKTNLIVEYQVFNDERLISEDEEDLDLFPLNIYFGCGYLFKTEGAAIDYWNSKLRNALDRLKSDYEKSVEYFKKKLI